MDAFIKIRGGSDNASTDCELTTFYFEIQGKHLLPALDRFAQFFIKPLMKKDAITREREAVESGIYQYIVNLLLSTVHNNIKLFVQNFRWPYLLILIGKSNCFVVLHDRIIRQRNLVGAI